MLDRAGIAARIPHAGRMQLLDRVLAWDAQSIRCASLSHRDPGNPLREKGGLPVWSGVEYAAQAAAVHGALLAGASAPRAGVLAALKNLDSHGAWLHDVEGELQLLATLMHSDPKGAIYRFEVRSGEALLLSGQFTLMYLAAPGGAT